MSSKREKGTEGSPERKDKLREELSVENEGERLVDTLEGSKGSKVSDTQRFRVLIWTLRCSIFIIAGIFALQIVAESLVKLISSPAEMTDSVVEACKIGDRVISILGYAISAIVGVVIGSRF